MNGPRCRAEQTGLAQPLWARLSLSLHGFMPPNTQMDREARREEGRREGRKAKNGKCGEGC